MLCAAAATAVFSACAAGPRFDIARFTVQGNTLLPASEVDALLSGYTGANRDFADVQKAMAALQAAYAKRGFNLVRVALPEQELDHGVVRLDVVETRIGRVTVEGNHFFDTASIRRSVPGLVEGEKPNIGRISASLLQANENPAKKTTLELQGGNAGEVDARLSVVDERPWRFTFTADNTGAPQTGRTLMSFIYQNANVASRDHVLSLQYSTTAEEPKNVNVYGFGYHIPLYALGDSLDVYANYSDIDSGTVLAGNFALQITGRGKIAGARYNHAFARAGEFQSAATLGIDHKAYENSAVLLGFDLGNAITVHPLSLSYWGLWKGAQSDLSFNLTGVHNIPGGNKGSDREFEAARANARTDYNLARYSLTYTHQLPMQWHALALVQGQYTRDKLIAGEQFGAGGVTSVRGFESREIAADNGYSGTLELHTPELCARWNNASCRALVFLDGARLRRNTPFPGEFGEASIAGTGLGLRAGLGRNASLLLDYGYVLDGGAVTRHGDSKLNFRLSLTY